MRKPFVVRGSWFVVSVFLCSLLSTNDEPAFAAEKPKTGRPKSEAAAQKVQEEAMKQQMAKKEEALSKLDGTQWAVEVHPLSGEKPKRPTKDTLRFEGRKIASEAMMKEGYPATNYTLTVGDDGSIVWETMQTKEGAGVAFWRGELQAETMRGILSKHPAEGNPLDFSFNGKKIEAAPPAAPESAPLAVTPASPEVMQPKTTPPPASSASGGGQSASGKEDARPEGPKAGGGAKKGWW